MQEKHIFALASEKSKQKLYIRAISSVGSEHLVYTEGVGGSNPSAPTKIPEIFFGIFLSLYRR